MGVLICAWTRIDPTAAPQYAVRAIRSSTSSVFAFNILPMGPHRLLRRRLHDPRHRDADRGAAFGAFATLLLAIAYRALSWDAIKEALMDAFRVSAMSFLLIIFGSTFSQLIAIPGVQRHGELGDRLRRSSPAMLIMMIAVILFLGLLHGSALDDAADRADLRAAREDARLRHDLVGVIILLALEIGYTTPPFGLLLFVMKGVSPPGTTMRDIYLAGLPFIACVLLLIVLIIAFPPLATWLPALGR